ncbi:hypothetical protein TU86_10390 [Pseudomonas weihenstephanensis]|uniref:Uncharacterized protein n=1 Tax=Pseudomonas weihenstephanensis TaxID=1608994 RepID=A0A0J6IRZ2_9PSED|nr:hypothetical protein TU86_10390 [Pseudomonas weihenstephanensis]KMN17225.1 hypothetical protein TU87_17015 [Pseudomonas weihenstephanensis]
MNNRVEFVIAVKQVFETYVYAHLLSSRHKEPFVPKGEQLRIIERLLNVTPRASPQAKARCGVAAALRQ